MSGVVVWLTGLHHAGKTTLARALRARLSRHQAIVLDEEELHPVFDRVLPFEPGDGDAFYGTVARLAALLAQQGFVVLVAAASKQRVHREAARLLAPRFVEVHVATPPELQPGRLPHGFYFRSESRAGAPYDPPLAPEVIARGGEDAYALERVLAAIIRDEASAGAAI